MLTRQDLLELFCCVAAALTSACSQSNNLFFGEVNAVAGSHRILVTDCYRLHVDPPQATADGYRYTPCRDADVLIRNEEAVVNGHSYGSLKPGDSILVDHGAVSITHLRTYVTKSRRPRQSSARHLQRRECDLPRCSSPP